jgi:hypothetical protein
MTWCCDVTLLDFFRCEPPPPHFARQTFTPRPNTITFKGAYTIRRFNSQAYLRQSLINSLKHFLNHQQIGVDVAEDYSSLFRLT